MLKSPSFCSFSFCNFLEKGIKLSHSLIKSVIQPIWPTQKSIFGQDTFNIHVKIKRLLSTFFNSKTDYDIFKSVVNQSELLSGIDDKIILSDDKVHELAYLICQKVLDTATNNKDSIFSVIEYLDLMSPCAKGLPYEILADSCGGENKLLGVLWMIATMRYNFELFGDFVCLDMIKCGINTLLWPYLALALIDELNHMCIGL